MEFIHKSKLSDRGFSGINYALLVLFTIACMYPFYYVFIYSISDPAKVVAGVTWAPRGFTFYNYVSIFKLEGIIGAFMNSAIRTVGGTLFTLFCCSIFAYTVTKEQTYFRKFLYRFVILTMFFNPGLIPVYLTMKSYGLINSFWIYILPFAVSAYFIILLKTFIEQLPLSLEEAALIDGAGYFTVFMKIILPLSQPILATIAVFSAVNQWNSWFDNYLYVSNPKLQTLQYLLYQYLTESQRIADSIRNMNTQQMMDAANQMVLTPEGVRMTITMIAIIPILVVYPMMQKYFVKGIMMGAVKG
ncbi:carbohydrate ABC transporter permease [Cohnella sp. LGH]|uniref:carbohydrate ABC transporter permease n=1 Tax=Cohnella sp. LGH TaxID=1619153 RepID=UPI001ADC720D|nr:carbohydrate ABC transporter permease [Cohnella sp. LGH]QTH41539.1 carbohydrate ABC transporter permease [Cohnella sp. LGH]